MWADHNMKMVNYRLHVIDVSRQLLPLCRHRILTDNYTTHAQQLRNSLVNFDNMVLEPVLYLGMSKISTNARIR